MDHAPLLRPAHEGDVSELAELWTEAFPGARTAADREREMREGMVYGTLADCRVLDLDGRIAAGARAYPMQLHVRGRVWPTVGLAGVAVAPDLRRRGLGRRICLEVLAEARERGTVLSLLYPFRVSFYAGLGYTLAGERHHYRFRPADLPLWPGWERVERGEPGDLPDVQGLYRRVAVRCSGMIERRRSAWRLRSAAGNRFYLYRSEGGVLEGYLVVRAARRRDPALLQVVELLWETEAAYRALLGWVAAQRDQFAWATHDALPSEAFHRHLPHPRFPGPARPRSLWFESARVLRGPMLRVLDVGALQEPGTPGELQVRDPELPANQGTWIGGRRMGGAPSAEALPMPEVARAFLAGTLPGQAAPPADWEGEGDPSEFRLLDEF